MKFWYFVAGGGVVMMMAVGASLVWMHMLQRSVYRTKPVVRVVTQVISPEADSVEVFE